jgi:Xaa-Pro dipeptidase
MLTPENLPAIQSTIAEMGLDGWLLFDFRATNPIAVAMLNIQGMVTRRIFAWVPARGVPVAITHAIEQQVWQRWPAQWRREVYSGWQSLEDVLAKHVRDKKVAMEYSPADAVPYLDRIPAGVIEMVRAAGATVSTSADLVSRFYAQWTPTQIASHKRAAEVLAEIARNAFSLAGAQTLTEFELANWIRAAFARGGLVTDHGPIVAIGPNAANPHYEPTAARSDPIGPGSVLLIDLFAHETDGVWADQTWVGTLGPPDGGTIQIWEAVRDARDAAIALVRSRLAAGETVRGLEADDAARAVIAARGYGARFTHRTGHSIDAYELHGAGPHLDHLESRDDRALIPGVAFSIEPGIYVPGVIGVRSEVNAIVGDGELLVTPAMPQRDLFVV